MKEREERKRKGERERNGKREREREGGLRECGRGREWKRV